MCVVISWVIVWSLFCIWLYMIHVTKGLTLELYQIHLYNMTDWHKMYQVNIVYMVDNVNNVSIKMYKTIVVIKKMWIIRYFFHLYVPMVYMINNLWYVVFKKLNLNVSHTNKEFMCIRYISVYYIYIVMTPTHYVITNELFIMTFDSKELWIWYLSLWHLII